MKKLMLTVGVITLLAFLPDSLRTESFTRPTGIYALGNPGQVPQEEVVSLPFVDGWAMRTAWTFLEPTPGSYDFSSIDATIAGLERFGKKLTLIVFGFEVPQHLLATLPAEERYLAIGPQGNDVETAVTWSGAALQRWESLAQALAGHPVWDAATGTMVPLRDHSLLAQVDCSVVGLGSVRDKGMRLVSTPGYNRDAFVSATLRSINAIEDQFPAKFTYVGFFRMADNIIAPPLDEYLLDVFRMEWFNGASTPHLGLFQENLACSTPGAQLAFAMFQEQANTYTMFQMLQSWINPFSNPARTDPCLVMTNPPDRSSAISGPEVGIQYGYETYSCRYFEVYQTDLSHPGFADEFQTWHDILQSTLCSAAKGDMNADGTLTSADVVLELNCVFLGVGIGDLCYADVKCDGVLTASDVVCELNSVFLGQPCSCP